MKQFYSTVAALFFGLATPLLTEAIIPMSVVAKVSSLGGTFVDKEWTISVYSENNTYHYQGYNIKTKKSINLAGAILSGNRQRRVYTWNNQGTRYQVTWQAQDPDYIRVKVIVPNGKEVLNRLLPRSVEQGC
jgi:hypothetical protein